MRKILFYTVAIILLSVVSVFAYTKIMREYLPEHRLPDGAETSVHYYETKIDSCEYIVVTHDLLEHYSVSITHKGNCSNPIHKK